MCQDQNPSLNGRKGDAFDIANDLSNRTGQRLQEISRRFLTNERGVGERYAEGDTECVAQVRLLGGDFGQVELRFISADAKHGREAASHCGEHRKFRTERPVKWSGPNGGNCFMLGKVSQLIQSEKGLPLASFVWVQTPDVVLDGGMKVTAATAAQRALHALNFPCSAEVGVLSAGMEERARRCVARVIEAGAQAGDGIERGIFALIRDLFERDVEAAAPIWLVLHQFGLLSFGYDSAREGYEILDVSLRSRQAAAGMREIVHG